MAVVCSCGVNGRNGEVFVVVCAEINELRPKLLMAAAAMGEAARARKEGRRRGRRWCHALGPRQERPVLAARPKASDPGGSGERRAPRQLNRVDLVRAASSSERGTGDLERAAR